MTADARVILVEAKYAPSGRIDLKLALKQLAQYAKALTRAAKGSDWLRELFEGTYRRKHCRWAAEAGAPFQWSLQKAAGYMLGVRPNELGEWQQALGRTIQSGKARAIVAMNSGAAPRRDERRPVRPQGLRRWQVGVLKVWPEHQVRAARAGWVWPRLQ